MLKNGIRYKFGPTVIEMKRGNFAVNLPDFNFIVEFQFKLQWHLLLVRPLPPASCTHCQLHKTLYAIITTIICAPVFLSLRWP